MIFWRNFSKNLLLPIFFLAIFSLLTLLSLSANDTQPYQIFKKQLLWFLLGFLIFYLVSQFFDYRILVNQNLFVVGFYFVCLLFLVLVLIAGLKIRGTSGWLKIGFLHFQPIELAKLALIIILARYFSLWHIELWHPGRILATVFYTGLYAVLVFLQPDAGSAILLIIVWLSLLLISGLKFKQFAFLAFLLLVLGVITWFSFLKPYQRERILVFFNPTHDPLGAGYNVNQAKIAIGSGGFFGRGLGWGIATQLRFLPEAKTDFFLAAFLEEWGFFGGLLLFLVYFWLVFQLVNLGLRVEDNFPRLFIYGYLTLLITQIVINFGSNLGFLPVTGLPLPFLSYGGSNLLINFLSVAIIENIRKNSRL